MMRMRIGAVVLSVLMSAGALASDLAKEQRWADQIVDALFDGEAVWLPAGGHEFLGIYTESGTADSTRGAIIAHGIGVHPNWPDVVYPLRTRLPALGWQTLSIQMPVLPNDADPSEYAALIDEVAPRLDAAIAYLREQGVETLVLIGHSLGSTMMAHYLASETPAVAGFAAVGMSAGIRNSEILNLDNVQKIKLPMLDLYGSDDLEEVLVTAPQRRAAKSAADAESYTQQQVDGANHFFQGHEDDLVEAASGWLETAFGTGAD